MNDQTPAQQPSLLGALLGGLAQNAESQVAAQLPTQAQLVQGYIAGAVAFWLIGGVTLYIVATLLKPKR